MGCQTKLNEVKNTGRKIYFRGKLRTVWVLNGRTFVRAYGNRQYVR